MLNIQNGDCLNLIKNIPDESVDLIVTDPPYRITSRGSSSSTMGGYMIREPAKCGKIFDYNDISCKEYLPELFRVLKNGTHCYIMINNINLQEMLNEATNVGFKFIKSIIWNKGNKISGQWYMGCYEYILMFRKGEARPINNPGTPDILTVKVNKLKAEDGTNLHDTEKPVELMEILINNSSNKGDVVMDPFMGIGATGVAATINQRDFIGFEIDEKFFNIASSRITGGSIIRHTDKKVRKVLF